MKTNNAGDAAARKALPRYWQTSFRNKLQTAFLVLILLAIALTGGLSYTISAKVMEKNALKLTQESVAKSAQIVDEKLNKLMLIMMTFMISQPFHDMLKDASAGEASRYYTHLNDLDNVFSQARMAEPLIQSIFITTPIGDFYPLSLNRNHQTDFYQTFLYERIHEEKRNIWVEGHPDPLFSGGSRVVSLIMKPIFDTPVNDVYIVVNIREEGLRKLVGGDAEGGAVSLIMNNEGTPVYPVRTGLAKLALDSGRLTEIISAESAGNTPLELEKQDYLLNYARLPIPEWTLVTLQSKAHVLKDMTFVQWMILMIAAGAFLVTVLVSGAFTRYLLRPLQALQRVMKRVETNDLTARYEGGGSDELAQAGYRFNRMLDQIVILIQEVKQAETRKRSAEIKALSAQMDPHFLYNTLNTIYWKLSLNQVEPSQTMVVSLSRLFQLGLNKGNEITTLAKELEHVRQYLELQKSCYEGLFDYRIQTGDPQLLQLPVPRILLQPLAENCILHGFRDRENGGLIVIDVEAEAAGRKSGASGGDDTGGNNASGEGASRENIGPGGAVWENAVWEDTGRDGAVGEYTVRKNISQVAAVRQNTGVAEAAGRSPSEEAGAYWTITVKDNGRGMEPDVHPDGAEEHGYALTNLLSRLKLYYGDDAELTIKSPPAAGTEVRIRLPWRGELHDV